MTWTSGASLKHLIAPHWIVHARVSAAVRSMRIEAAIAASEKSHDGELRFAVEGGLASAARCGAVRLRASARRKCSRSLRVWDTEHNSGVLIYVQLVDRRIEIVADRGISAKVAQAEWDAICRRMEAGVQARAVPRRAR